MNVYHYDFNKTQYLKHKILDRKETVSLIKKAQKGCKESTSKLVQNNLRLVVKIANKTNRKMTLLTIEDLVQEGIFGLYDAIEKFDVTRDIKFSTYATYWIWQKISRAITNQDRMIRLPVHLNDHKAYVKKRVDKFVLENNRNPTLEELAQICPKYSYEELAKYFNLPTTEDVLSLYDVISPVSSKDIATRFDVVKDLSIECPIEKTSNVHLKEAVQKILDTVAPSIKPFIIMRFGFDGNKPMTLQQIGHVFNISRERVRQIINKALNEIRSDFSNKHLRDFLEDV